MTTVKAGARLALEAVTTWAPELTAGGAAVGGWLLITWGLASLLHVWQVWPLSLGLLLLSLFGWRLLYRVVRDGLYVLTREGS